jgi:hypothetical protein
MESKLIFSREDIYNAVKSAKRREGEKRRNEETEKRRSEEEQKVRG